MQLKDIEKTLSEIYVQKFMCQEAKLVTEKYKKQGHTEIDIESYENLLCNYKGLLDYVESLLLCVGEQSDDNKNDFDNLLN